MTKRETIRQSRGVKLYPENETKHSAGPWRTGTIVAGDRDHADRQRITAGQGSGWLADVLIWDDCPEESKANARLIASAPDLLEALKGVVAWIDQYHPKASQNLTLSRAAISKAEGRE